MSFAVRFDLLGGSLVQTSPTLLCVPGLTRDRWPSPRSHRPATVGALPRPLLLLRAIAVVAAAVIIAGRRKTTIPANMITDFLVAEDFFELIKAVIFVICCGIIFLSFTCEIGLGINLEFHMQSFSLEK